MQDAKSINKRQIKTAVFAVCALIFLLFFGMWISDPNKGKPNALEVAKEKSKEVKKNFTVSSRSAASAEDTWIALSEKRFASIEHEQGMLTDAVGKNSDKIDQVLTILKGENGVVPTAPQTPNSTPVKVPPLLPNTGKPNVPSLPSKKPAPQVPGQSNFDPSQRGLPKSVPDPLVPGGAQPQGDLIEEISFEENAGSGKSSTNNISHYLPAGAFATVVLLAGVDAPTGGKGESDPVPVLLRLMDDGKLPNFFQSEIDRCHLVAEAYGDLSSERAYIRTKRISCVLVNGDVVEESITGYIAGEDGKAGMRGRLVSKQGSVIAKSLLAGIASGVGVSVTDQYSSISTNPLGTVTTIDPDKTFQAGLAQGSANAMERVAQYYLDRANEMYPIIEVGADRIGELVVLKGVDLKKNIIGNTREGFE